VREDGAADLADAAVLKDEQAAVHAEVVGWVGCIEGAFAAGANFLCEASLRDVVA